MGREAPGDVAVELLQWAAEGPEVDGSDIGKSLLGHFKLDVLVPQYVRQVVSAHIRQPALKQPGDHETKRSCLAVSLGCEQVTGSPLRGKRP